MKTAITNLNHTEKIKKIFEKYTISHSGNTWVMSEKFNDVFGCDFMFPQPKDTMGRKPIERWTLSDTYEVASDLAVIFVDKKRSDLAQKFTNQLMEVI